VASHNTSIRFITDLASEAPALQDAVQQMMYDLSSDRVEEEARLADIKARAVAAVEHAINAASRQEPGS
jgi:hypothetical protein